VVVATGHEINPATALFVEYLGDVRLSLGPVPTAPGSDTGSIISFARPFVMTGS
jgi:hypothetical protein